MKTSIIAALIGSTMLTAAWAADVPAGTQLADDQTYTYRVLDEYDSLDPQMLEGADSSVVVRDLIEGLYNTDATGAVVPGVALSHTKSDDGLVYTFTLRDTAKWSDGKPVTAGDFVYSWKRAVDPALASPYAWYMELMSVAGAAEIIAGTADKETLGVKAVDDHTFEVTLSKPLAYFPEMVVHTTTFPAPQWAIEAHGKEWTRPGNYVGNGAFVLKDHVPKERLVMERNPEYWDNEHTVIEQVVALVIGDENQALTRYKAGELDKTDIPAGQYPALAEELPDEAYAVPRLCNYYFNFNLSDQGPEAFKDVRVRKALALALDRQVLVDAVLKGGQFPAYTFTPAATSGFEVPEIDYATMTQAERDAEAVKLMEEAGYGKDKPLEFAYLYNTSDSHKQIAIVATQMWKQKLGVNATLDNQEWKVFLENRGSQNFDMARGAWCGDYNEASTFLDLLNTSSGSNDAKYSNARVDELLSEAKTAEETTPLYTEIEQIVATDMPVIPVYHYSANMMLKANVEGWPVDDVTQNIYSRNLYKIAE